MGTRAATKIEGILNLYRQFDGYPAAHGMDLCEFLDGMIITNGYSLSRDTPAELRIANGERCLAAQIVAHFKKGPGQFYLNPLDDVDGVDFEYHIKVESQLQIKVTSRRHTLFVGFLPEFRKFCAEDES